MSALPGETPQAFHERRVRQLYRRLDRSLPPRQPAENDGAYWFRADRQLKEAMASESFGAAGQVAAAGIAGFAFAGLLITVLGAALGAVLAMPGMVAYRDMCRLAQPAAGTSVPPRL